MADDLTAGKEVVSYCLKCKQNFAHTITSVVGDDVSKIKVKCNTCGSGPKKFRPPKDPAALVKKKRVTKAKAAAQPLSFLAGTNEDKQKWNDLKAEAGEPDSTKYNVKKEFVRESWILHKSFGLGYVDLIINEKRIEVLFEEGRKLLATNH